jgi:hypothetical protein
MARGTGRWMINTDIEMNTQTFLLMPDFHYAEFTEDVHCPFCCALLIKKSPEKYHEDDQTVGDDDDDGNFFCDHVGLWALGSHWPNVNEDWRNEMFTLTKEIKNQVYDGEEGYFWQEALERAVHEDGDGCIGGWTANALPNYQVAVYKQFRYDPDLPGQRFMSYLAIILRKK